MSHFQQDDLAHLFARNMALTQQLPQSTPDKQFMMQQQQQQPSQPQIIYSSQHYTGTYYLSMTEPTLEETTTRADSPFDNTPPSSDFETTLRQHNIDPSSLTPSQIKLFTNADNNQRLRLLELWQIAPPQNRGHAHSYDAVWPLTTLAQEEELARLRYESQQNISHQSGGSSPEMQEAEPYVVSGYAGSVPPRIDPVYAAAAGAWQAVDYSQAVKAMEMRSGLEGSQQMGGFYQGPQQSDEMVM